MANNTKNNVDVRRCNVCNSDSYKLLFEKYGFKLVKCLNCELAFIENVPSKKELEKLYSFNSGYHEIFLNENSPESKYHRKLAEKHYEILSKYEQQGNILDVGCSVGLFLQVTQSHGWKSYGLELSKDSVDIARNKYGLNVAVGTVEKNNFKNNYFDAITMWEVIEHVPDPTKTLSIVNTLLKADGILVMSTPNIDGLYPQLSYLVSKIINYWPHPEPPHHLFQFSKKTLTRILEKTGFSVLEIIDNRQPIMPAHDELFKLFKSPHKLIYFSFFALFSVLGPYVKSGDNMIIIAKKIKNIHN